MSQKNISTVQAVIFDLDGTLVDSLQDLTDACNAVMASYGLPDKTYEEGKTLIGRGLRNLITRALPETMRDETTITEAHRRMLNEYAKRYTAKTKPYEGISEVLSFLKGKGIPFALNTNKPDGPAKLIVNTLLNGDDFVDIVGDREDHPRKPDPAMALVLAEKMGVAPTQCVYCGDSAVDYETAVNGGMLPLICTWGFTAPAVLHQLEDAFFVENPRELLVFFQKYCVK